MVYKNLVFPEIIEEEAKKKKDKLVILSYGDSPKVSTGYGQVWDNLLSRWVKLKPNWEFKHVSWQSQDREHKREGGYTILPTGKLEYAFDTVVSNISKYNPDFVITLCDIPWQGGFVEQIATAKNNGWRGKWIAYTPIDTHTWAMTWDQIMGSPDINVAMAKFGETQMKANKVPNVVRIDHGTDNNVYKPLDKLALKEKYGLKDKFTIGFVGRNQERKMIDRLMMGFAKFAENKDDVILLLHTDQETPKDGWSIPYMNFKFKIKEKVKITKTNLDIAARQKLTPDNMNEIFNMMDIFCYATGGEGFGLPAIEAQSVGLPFLMTDCTTAREFTETCGEVIPVLLDKYGRKCVKVGQNGAEFVYPDDVAMADLLEKYYQDWKNGGSLLKEESKKSRENSLKYSWDNLAPQWIELFENNS
jgi:glycosyltransferase involved in cell wall biosynthesis